MGKAVEKSPSTDVFKNLFGNLKKGGLSLFSNNPFQRKLEKDVPQRNGVDGLKTGAEEDGPLAQGKRKFKVQNDENTDQRKKKSESDDGNLGRGTKKTNADNEIAHSDDGNLGQWKEKTKADTEFNEILHQGKKKKADNENEDPSFSNENSSNDEKKKKKKKKKNKNSVGEDTDGKEIPDHFDEERENLSHKMQAERDKNDVLNSRKRKDAVAEELVQTKKEKKKKIALQEIQQPVQEGQIGDFQETPARKHIKRMFEEQGIDEPSKKIKVNHWNSQFHMGQKGADGLGNGLTVSNGVQADGTEKANLRKRKRDAIEDEYEARHGMEAVESLTKEEVIAKKTIGKRKRDDDVADMVAKKQTFDDGEKLQRTIFIGNLPLHVKRKRLIKEFSQFGDVESIRLRSVPILDSKLPRKSAILKGQINDSVSSVHAYVVFKDEVSAHAALSHNMVEFCGNHIRVDRAHPPCKKLRGGNTSIYDNKRTVFVGNLPFDVKDEELYRLFIGIKPLESNVEAVRVIRDPQTSMGKGIAYVLFKTMDAAKLAVKKNQFKLRDRNLRLCRARPDSNPKVKPDSTPRARSDTSSLNRLSGKRPAESELMSNGSSKKKTKCTPSYQGTKASKIDGRPGKGIGLTSINKDGNNFKKLYSPHANDPKPRKFKRPAVTARRAEPSQSAGPSHSGKKRKLSVEGRTGYSKSPKKARAH
eukprot:Gb_00609 [translate_table: standard]